MKIAPLLLFFLIGQVARSQQTLRGRVVSETTQAGIPGSSVFIANSSKGTTSNENGFFELAGIPAGNHQLIISSIGYETNVFSFKDADLPLQVKIELALKVTELGNVTLEPWVEEGWDRWGTVFMENFVGNSANASHCRILNPKAIRFRYYKKSNRLKAYCDEPVLLENRALGYTISYQLEDFEVNFRERSLSYLGYPLYQPIEKDRKNLMQKWERNRQEAYNGSVIHFMRSLYTNRISEEGFEVRRMVRLLNFEKQRVRNIYRTSGKFKTDPVTGLVIQEPSASGPAFPPDSIKYFQAILRQDDYKDWYGENLLSADSLVIKEDGEFNVLYFEDFLFITFRKEKEEPGYVKTQFPPRAASFQRSLVTLIGDKIIVLDKNGNYYSPKDFVTSGYWGWNEKMANSLPLDYDPGKSSTD